MTEAGHAVADVRGPLPYLWWLVRRQKLRIAAGALLGSLWMVGLTLPPYLLSQAIDRGLQRRDLPAKAHGRFAASRSDEDEEKDRKSREAHYTG